MLDLALFNQAMASVAFVGCIGALLGITAKRWIDRG